jgi:ribosomal protein S18 acetylase RimI-like enzyme
LRASNGVAVRVAAIGDAPAIARVHCASWRSTYPGLVPQKAIDDWANLATRTDGWTQALTTARNSLWVSEQAGEIVGFCCAGAARPPANGADGQLFALYLQQQAQRQGIGEALTRTALQALYQEGHKAVRVEVLKGNLRAIEFYERMGARFVESTQFEMSGFPLVELIYVWDDLRRFRS